MMKRVLISALLLAAALGPAATLSAAPPAAHAAPQPAKPKRACFYSENLSNWIMVDDETVNILVGAHDVFQLKLFSPCPELRDALAIGVRTRMGPSFVCDGLDIDLVAPSPIGPRRCPVTAMRKLTPEEVAALPRKQRP